MIKQLIKRLRRSDFVRNAATLATGTTLAQSISIITAPILYRIYDKEDYGTLGLYMAITGVVGVFSTLQYLQAILLEKEDDEAKKVMWLNRIVNIIFTLILVFFVIFFKKSVGIWFNNPNISVWLYLLPISIFFSGQNEIFRVWANRKKQYRLMSLNAIVTAIAVPAVSITLGVLNEGALGLFLGLLASQVVPPLILLIGLTRHDDLGLKYLDLLSIKQKAYQHRMFPIYSLPSSFINRFTNQLPVFMLSTYAGAGVVGIYNLCVRMLGLPIQLIGSAIGEVFKQKASHEYNNAMNFSIVFSHTLKGLIGIAVVPFVVLVLFSPDIFEFVFGLEWREAGIFAQILSTMFLFRFIASPLSYSFVIVNRLQEDMFWHIWMLISNALIFYIGFNIIHDYKIVISAFSANYTIIYIVYLYRSYLFSKYNKT